MNPSPYGVLNQSILFIAASYRISPTLFSYLIIIMSRHRLRAVSISCRAANPSCNCTVTALPPIQHDNLLNDIPSRPNQLKQTQHARGQAWHAEPSSMPAIIVPWLGGHVARKGAVAGYPCPPRDGREILQSERVHRTNGQAPGPPLANPLLKSSPLAFKLTVDSSSSRS